MKTADLNMLGKISGVYELKPGVVYLVLMEAKNFSYELAQALLRKVDEDGIDLHIHIVASLHAQSIEIHEAASEKTT